MKALIVVDMQVDFMEGGALAVKGGRALVAPINVLMWNWPGIIVLTQDWHPSGHCSFVEQGGPWPAHCVRDSRGAQFAEMLSTDRADVILRKGTSRDRDSYSAFFDNGRRDLGLLSMLLSRGVRETHFVGLARDYCVLWSARDAAIDGGSGLRPHVIWGLTASVSPENDEATKAKYLQAGVRVI